MMEYREQAELAVTVSAPGWQFKFVFHPPSYSFQFDRRPH